ALAPCRLGEWPTPLEPAPALAGALGVAAFSLKREDRAATRGGGNKVRGLEFLLAGVPSGIVFVTAGGTGSTHCLCTAVHAAALGHRTVLAQFRQPDTVESRAVAMSRARRAVRLLARHAIRIPFPVSRFPLVVVDGLGKGYGHPSPEGEAARRLASQHGLALDPTYGAKAFACLLQRAACDVQRVVFWHTFAVP